MNTQMFALVWLLVLAAPQVPSIDSRPLGPGSVIAHEGPKGGVSQFGIELRAGDFLELSVSQEQAVAELTLLAPDDVPVRRIGLVELSPLDAHLLFIAPTSGRYRLDVTLQDHPESLDRYTVRVAALRAATGTDHPRNRCFTTLAEGDRLAHVERLESFALAIDRLQAAASCWREAEDADLEVATLTSLGALASLFGQSAAAAAAAYERLAQIYETAGDPEHVLASLGNAIRELEDNGQFDRARETSRRMRDLATRVGDRRRQAYAVSHVAFTELMLGNYLRAREAAAAAQDIAIEVQDGGIQGFALVTLAHLDELAGDDEAAKARYDRIRVVNPRGRFTRSLLPIELGFLHLRRGEYELAAASFNERLSTAATNIQPDQEAMARVGLGDVRAAHGDRRGARLLYEEAQATLARSHTRYRCVGLERLGRLNLADNRLDDAAAQFEEMLVNAERMGYPPCEARGRAGLAALASQRGDLVTAEIETRRVVELTESFREAVPSIESRALGFGALAPAFEQAVDIGMRLAARGDPLASARAFELNERALARGLLDRIARAGIEERARIPDTLARDRQRVREEWRRRVAEMQVAAFDTAGSRRLEALRTEVADLEVQLRDLDARIDASGAPRADLASPQPLNLAQIQALLDPDTVLVEYALGARQSFVWVVSSSAFHGVPLAPRRAIEASARLVRGDLASAGDALGSLARTRRQALADLILAPATPLLRARRLIIVSTGELSLVPFGALPSPGPGARAPMLARYEIVHAPSGSTLAALRAASAHRAPATQTAVILADPIFDRADPRVTKKAEVIDSAAQAAAPLGQVFRRLPFSRDEARAISAMLPGQVTTIMDGQATRERVLGSALADYRVVHFATHGVVHPELTSLSSIVLSLVDDQGRAHDPFLTLSDIYDMRLNADVVVLSACSTVAGKEVPGEGPIGLARAFMYAGAPRVVASLWDVSDRATAELMKRFYRGMLMEGLPAAAALRSAQRQLAAMPRWHSPYHWAGFVLQGDWR